jgi:hypothetical protein
MSAWNTTTLGTPPQPTWLLTRNKDTQGEPHQGCHTRSSSSLLHEPATLTSPATSRTELHKQRRSPCRSMPPIGHTRQGQTALNQTTSFTRELCGSCTDRELCRPPAAGHRRHGDTAPPTPQQHDKQENPSDKPGKPTSEAPPRPIFHSSHHLCQTAHMDLTQQPTTTIFPQTRATPRRCPQQGRDTVAPPSPDPRSEVSLWSRGRRRRSAHTS